MRMMNYLFGVVIAPGLAGAAPHMAQASQLQPHRFGDLQSAIVRVADQACIQETCGGNNWRQTGFGSREECREVAVARFCSGNDSGDAAANACVEETCGGNGWRDGGFSSRQECREIAATRICGGN